MNPVESSSSETLAPRRSFAIETGVVMAICLIPFVIAWAVNGGFSLRHAGEGTHRHIGQFELQNQSGTKVSSSSLAGNIWLANFIFVQCSSTCEDSNRATLKLLGDERFEQVDFVSFSVDPADAPAALARYVERFGDHKCDHWSVLAADQKTFPDVCVAMGLAKSADAVRKGQLPLSAQTYLIDRDGSVIAEFDMLNAKSRETLHKQLLQLAGNPE